MAEEYILPEFNEDNYPFTKGLLSVYDTATDWQKEVNGKYTHRELFRFACQFKEERAKAKQLKRDIARLEDKKKVEREKIQGLKANIAILSAIKEHRLFKG